MKTIPIESFLQRLQDARIYDAHVWPRLKQEDWLLERWAFDNTGAHYIGSGPEPRQPNFWLDWAAVSGARVEQ